MLNNTQDARVVEPRAVQPGLQPHPSIKNIIAVGSGKGGVGKSTVAVNLALSLKHQGARVGLLDADIYGPSQSIMLGLDKPDVLPGKKFKPLERYGMQAISMGCLVPEDSAMIWRGPMVSSALKQLLNDTQWDNLDYLIIDLPPGTGDIQLTLAQKIPVSGAIVVTTPQDIALLDAKKAITMFNKVNITVLGIVENMSLHTCAACGHTEAIFGEAGGQVLSDAFDIPLLGQLPLDKQIREEADSGKPTVEVNPTSHNALLYQAIANNAIAQLALQKKDFSHKFGNIVVES